MPLRLPTRRKAEETGAPFRRRTPPTPQATRLMRVSLAAGVLLVVVLGIVFIPTALRYGEVKPPVVTLSISGSGPFNVTVASVSASFSLGTYHAWLNVTNGTLRYDYDVANLTDIPPAYGGAIRFTDVDGGGSLSAGDVFTVRAEPGTGWRYELSLLNTAVDQHRPECPCFVGVARWP